MEAIMMGGMVAGAIIEGAQSSGNVSDIEKQIATLQQTNSELGRNYQSLEGNISGDLTALKAQVTSLQQQKQGIADQLSAYRNTYDASNQRIMYIGIAFVAYVFFTLLMKLIIPKGGIIGLVEGI